LHVDALFLEVQARSGLNNESRSKISAMDKNEDGVISFLEWAQSSEAFAHVGLKKLAERWGQYDWEGKGYMAIVEAINRKSFVQSHLW
jgi:hypothetical protein